MSRATYVVVCRGCEQVIPEGTTIPGHYLEAHDGEAVGVGMTVACSRCREPMEHVGTVGLRDHFECARCRRSQMVRRG